METIFAGQYQVSGFRAGFMRPLGPQDGGVDGGLLSATLFRFATRCCRRSFGCDKNGFAEEALNGCRLSCFLGGTEGR